MNSKQHKSRESKPPKGVAKALKLIRIRNNLTQKEISKKLGVSLRSYSDYEQGKKWLPSHLAWRVKRQFGEVPNQLNLERNEYDPEAEQHQPREVKIQFEGKIELVEPEVLVRVRNWFGSRVSRKIPLVKDRFRATRDFLFFVSTFYFAMKFFAIRLEVPFGPEHGQGDPIFVASAALIGICSLAIIEDLVRGRYRKPLSED